VDPEKKSLTASERNEPARAAWARQAARVDPAAWVWLDETGSHRGYTPRYAWAPRGERARASAPRNQGENKTVIAALSVEGIGPRLRFDGAMTSDRFVGYVRHVLAPTLRPGQIVVADNLRAHHDQRARAAIEARGAQLWHLPAYSPDFNPIEEAFSKVKQALRRAAPRTNHDLRVATWAAFATITPADAAGWLTHCGYLPRAQRS
jgi:transposase